MNESKRTSQVLKRFRELYPDGIAWKFNDRIARSRPDAMFIRKGRVSCVEFKMEGNNPTPGQMLERQALNRAGVNTYVVWFSKSGRGVSFELGNPHETCTIDELCHFLA